MRMERREEGEEILRGVMEGGAQTGREGVRKRNLKRQITREREGGEEEM